MTTLEERKLNNWRNGGVKVSSDRKHMAEIGRKGGLKVSANRTHMSAIGRLGGKATQARKVTP